MTGYELLIGHGMAQRLDLRPYVMLIGAAIIFGSLFSLNKIVAEAGIPPVGYAFWQSALAGLVLWLIAVLRKAPPGVSWQHIRAYFTVGALAIGLPIALLTYVAPNLPAGILTLVLALSPPFTYLICVIIRIDRFYFLGGVGILFGFAGVAMLVGPTAALPSSDMIGWFTLSLIAPLCFALANVSAAVLRPPNATSTAMAAGILLGSATVVAPLMGLLGQAYWPVGAGAADWALLTSVSVNAAFVVLFLEITRLAGPTFFAQFNYLAAVAGIGWGAVFFGERLALAVWLALALMAIGIVLMAVRERWPRRRRSN